jgi:DNA-binding IscR family transcriptional regulator
MLFEGLVVHFYKTAQYAIRVFTYLHRHNESSHSVNMLHQELDLPYKYLTKMVTDLIKKGSINAMRPTLAPCTIRGFNQKR